MRHAVAIVLLSVFVLSGAAAWARDVVTLQSAFDLAEPGEGYDRLVILDPGTLYTGGTVVSGMTACIHGGGALIDLGGDGEILVTGGGGTALDVDHCVIVNGANGLHFDSAAEPAALYGTIRNNTFAGNRVAIRAFLTDPVKTMIENNLIVFTNAAYGVYVRETYEPVIQYNDVCGVPGFEYMRQCG